MDLPWDLPWDLPGSNREMKSYELLLVNRPECLKMILVKSMTNINALPVKPLKAMGIVHVFMGVCSGHNQSGRCGGCHIYPAAARRSWEVKQLVCGLRRNRLYHVGFLGNLRYMR